MSKIGHFKRGLWQENPTFRLVLGMCPVLAVTTAAINGVAMGLATTFVLVCSEVAISILRNIIPDKVRIPCYIIVAATFVTIVDYMLRAFAPVIAQALSIFLPLIVVNCIILGRCEAFASKNSIGNSVFDALGIGFGFTWALLLLASIRELMGSGTIFDVQIMGEGMAKWIVMVQPAGAFITLGILIALMNQMTFARGAKQNN